MPPVLSPSKRDTILYLQSTELCQVDAAELVGYHVQIIKNYVKKRKAWGDVKPLHIAKRGCTKSLTSQMIQVKAYSLIVYAFMYDFFIDYL